MLKSTLLATAICFAFIVPASAQSMKCDEASLTKMRTDVDAMSDKDKQKMTIANWEKAMAAMKANNMKECEDLMTQTGKSVSENKGNNNGSTSENGEGQGTSD